MRNESYKICSAFCVLVTKLLEPLKRICSHLCYVLSMGRSGSPLSRSVSEFVNIPIWDVGQITDSYPSMPNPYQFIPQ